MRVIKAGQKLTKWSRKCRCIGCGAILHIEQNDLFRSQMRNDAWCEDFVSFKCCECNVVTNIQDVPNGISSTLPFHRSFNESLENMG